MHNTLLSHLSYRRRRASAAVTAIRETTDDQQMLWLAADALEQAEHDLKLAVEYAESTGSITMQGLFAMRIKLAAIGSFKNYIAFLRLIPPSMLVLPILTAQLSLMFFGTWWLLFQLHIFYTFVLPFVVVNLVTFPFVVHASDQQVRFILDKALEIAEAAHEDLLLSVFLAHANPLLEDNPHE